MRYKTYKLQKLEKSRKESLFTDDMDHCYMCSEPTPKDDIHEVFPGRNRLNSIKYKLVMPLCRYHHQLTHNNSDRLKATQYLGQKLFEENYPDLDFLSIFHKNYK